jgi:hypothetical protein
MAINFNSLPNDRPNQLPTPGKYYATIEKAEMTNPKDPAKLPYLNLTLALQDKNGKSCGKIFRDMLSESDSDIVRYKIQRFITALGIPITDTFELKDLVKIVIGKKLIVDVTIDDPKKKDPNSPYAPSPVVDIFSGMIYYPLSEAAALFGTDPAGTEEVNAPDADDAGADTY